jgi:abequosyltransferase
MQKFKLSVCIATYNRGKFIAETLDSILSQLPSEVEVVVVDGASPDDTSGVMAQYTGRYAALRYYRETENSGVDGDYDKAVGYARGEYCWLMTDDDLLHPGAIKSVLDKLQDEIDLVVVNAEVRSADFCRILDEKLIRLNKGKAYGNGDEESLFLETMQGLSFIGCVVIRRDVWLARDRRRYYGSLFVHVGVIFQHMPISRAALIAEPLVSIRYGNAMWTPRGLEIWIVKWPELVWSFTDFSDRAKTVVCPRGGWHLIKRLMFYRATGAYTGREYDEIVSTRFFGLTRFAAKVVASVPVAFAGLIACIHAVALGGRGSRMVMYSLNSSRYGNAITRWSARRVGVC